MDTLSEIKILHLCYNTENTEQQGQIFFVYRKQSPDSPSSTESKMYGKRGRRRRHTKGWNWRRKLHRCGNSRERRFMYATLLCLRKVRLSSSDQRTLLPCRLLQ